MGYKAEVDSRPQVYRLAKLNENCRLQGAGSLDLKSHPCSENTTFHLALIKTVCACVASFINLLTIIIVSFVLVFNALLNLSPISCI